ncbi:Prolyl 4-hydroxylase subunit alpha-2, partial [Orchesella cincta]
EVSKGDEKVHDDYYTSLIGVQNLAKKEQQTVEQLVRYRSKLVGRLTLIDKYLKDYSKSIRPLIHRSQTLRRKFLRKEFPIFKKENDLQTIAEGVSSHPLMVFRLLRRFAKELPDIALNLFEDDIDKELKEYLDEMADGFDIPTEVDLNGAADGILRLQDTYQLSTYDLGVGKLVEKETGSGLLASDMQFIGVRAFNKEKHATSVEWIYYGLQKVKNGDDSVALNIMKEHLRYTSEYHNKELLSFKLTSTNLFQNLINSTSLNIDGLYQSPDVTHYPLGLVGDSIYDIYNFDALCRGEQLLSPAKTKNLHCWYSHDSPYNVISPLKFEAHHGNPPVYQVYDLISDNVIDHIKKLAAPNLKRAQVVGSYQKGGGIKSDVRTSSVAWLSDKQETNDTLLLKVPKIVHRATKLHPWASKSAEELQISCYGSVGGYYVPHLDTLINPGVPLPSEMDDWKKGDRVATIMFYLSDVELGGGTAFPRLGIASKAVKGSAVIWYNLRYNGERELLMLHGGCPVLYGNKWVANKWVRLYEQLHVRKCSKDRYQ